MNRAIPVINGPEGTYLDKENEILYCLDGEVDLKQCEKVFVLRTSGDWTPGWVIWFYDETTFEVLLEEKAKKLGKVRTKTVQKDMIKYRGEPA